MRWLSIRLDKGRQNTWGWFCDESYALLTLLQLFLLAWKWCKQLQVTKSMGFYLDFIVNPGHIWNLWCFQIIFLNYFVITARELQLSCFHVLAVMKYEGCRLSHLHSFPFPHFAGLGEDHPSSSLLICAFYPLVLYEMRHLSSLHAEQYLGVFSSRLACCLLSCG